MGTLVLTVVIVGLTAVTLPTVSASHRYVAVNIALLISCAVPYFLIHGRDLMYNCPVVRS